MLKKTREKYGVLTLSKDLFIGVIVFCCGTTGALASNTAGGQFLKLGADARSAAMGEAVTSIAHDVTASYWNPAGLTCMKEKQLTATYEAWLVQTNHQFVGFGLPQGKNAWAVSVSRLDYGNIDGYSAADVQENSFTAESMSSALSYARSFSDTISIGGSMKYVNETIESEKASTFAADAGVLVQQDFLSFGFALQHMGGSLKFVQEADPLPQTIRVGVSALILDKKLMTAFDLSKPQDQNLTYHLGLEYRIAPFVCLRGGYKATTGETFSVDGLTKLSGGLGVHVGKMTFDYAFVPFGDLSNTHKISLLAKF